AHAITDHFRQDTGIAPSRGFQFLEHQDSRPLSHHKSVAIAIPGTGSALGLIVAGRERPGGRKSADSHGSDAGFGSAANHDIGFTALNQPERIADGMSAGGAGGRSGGIRTFGAAADGHLAGSQIYDGGGNKKGRNPARPVFQQHLVLTLDDFESADP